MIYFFGLILLMFNPCNGLTLPKIFMDGMVLQGAPENASIWGFLDDNSTNMVELFVECADLQETYTYIPEENDQIFTFNVAINKEMKCDLELRQKDQILTLKSVYFGDVWICSGQSNMVYQMGGIFNSAEEILKLSEYPNLKMFRVKMMSASEPQNDLMDFEDGWEKWASVNETLYVRRFSAVCLLTAKYMADVLGKNKTFGLIQSAYGGTRIEAWSTKEGLTECHVKPACQPTNPKQCDSYLYNAMIHPLIRLTIYGTLWYQGEANIKWNTDLYSCTFSQMIKEWRRIWSFYSNTKSNFPFGLVQLSTNQQDQNTGTALVRWHQTNDMGYVPNSELQNVFMAVSLDTYDKDNGIHPRNKVIPSKRLASAGLNIAYGYLDFPFNGPFPAVIDVNKLSDEIQIEITYDQPFTWNSNETKGFYICLESNILDCNVATTNSLWQKLPDDSVEASKQAISMTVNSSASGLAYLWETTPVLGMEALPIYGFGHNGDYKLPGAPWCYDLLH